MKPKPKVSVFVLCSTERCGWINPSLCLSLIALQQDPRFDLTVEMVMDKRPVEHARNYCIVSARASGASACVQIDNDMTLPSNFGDIVHDAITTGKAVVGLPSGILQPGPRIIPEDNGAPDGQFRQAGCVGGGVLIISSVVWRVIPKGPWFQWVVNVDDEILSRRLSEDYAFCELVREHGLTIYTHQCVAGHFKTVNATHWALRLTRLENERARQSGGVLPLEVLSPPVFVEK